MTTEINIVKFPDGKFGVRKREIGLFGRVHVERWLGSKEYSNYWWYDAERRAWIDFDSLEEARAARDASIMDNEVVE